MDFVELIFLTASPMVSRVKKGRSREQQNRTPMADPFGTGFYKTSEKQI